MPHETPPPSPKPSPDDFDGIVSGLGTPTIETQRMIFDDVHTCHWSQWQEQGILGKIIDVIDVHKGELTVDLVRSMKLVPGVYTPVESHAFRVSWTHRRKVGTTEGVSIITRDVAVSETVDGIRLPQGRFDDDDAALVAAQLDELQALKDEGVLPALDPRLGDIVDPRTRIVAVSPDKRDKGS